MFDNYIYTGLLNKYGELEDADIPKDYMLYLIMKAKLQLLSTGEAQLDLTPYSVEIDGQNTNGISWSCTKTLRVMWFTYY